MLLKQIISPRTAHREEAENYHTVIEQAEAHRVIPYRDGLQWVLQRRAGKRHGQPRWVSLSYYTTRKALIRVWTAQTDKPCIALGKLPETIGGIA